MKAWTLNSPTQSPGDLQHSWAQTKDVHTEQGSGGRGGQDHLTRAQRQRARHWALPTSGAHYTCVVGALVCCSHSPLQQKPGKPDLCCSLPPSPPSSPYLHHPQLTAALAPGSREDRQGVQGACRVDSVGSGGSNDRQICRGCVRFTAVYYWISLEGL